MNRLLQRGLVTIIGVSTLILPGTVLPAALHAQNDTNATVHGKVVDPGGNPFGRGEIKFSTDKTTPDPKRVYKYTVPVGKDGTYTATDIAPGDYLIVVYADNKTVDFQTVVLKTKDDKTVDFDMTREEYLKAMTPEQRKALEEAKTKNAAVNVENAKIKDVNKTLIQARQDEKAGKADVAISELTPLTTQKPDEPVVWAALGEAQLAGADAAAKAAKAAKTPANDPAILQKYSDAAASYQKAIDLNSAKPKPIVEVQFSSYLNLGQALGRGGKPDDAAAAYENAAKADPTKAGTALYNEAATFFNANKLKEANAAADKAIAADPARAETYYIKAASLVPDAAVDPKTQKWVLPPGCLEAYQKYLEIAPTGPHAADVKGLLDSLGQPQRQGYKATKK